MDQITELAKYLKTYKPKEYLIKEEADDREFFCLLQGTVGIWKGSPDDRSKMVRVGELSEKGTYFGEMSYLLDEQRTASIVADTNVKVLMFPGDMLSPMVLKQPQLGLKLLKALADRLKSTTGKTEDIAQERNVLRGDAEEQSLHAKKQYQKVFIVLMNIQKQIQNQFTKSLIEYMSKDKLLSGGKQIHIDDEYLKDLPESLIELIKKLNP